MRKKNHGFFDQNFDRSTAKYIETHSTYVRTSQYILLPNYSNDSPSMPTISQFINHADLNKSLLSRRIETVGIQQGQIHVRNQTAIRQSLCTMYFTLHLVLCFVLSVLSNLTLASPAARDGRFKSARSQPRPLVLWHGMGPLQTTAYLASPAH